MSMERTRMIKDKNQADLGEDEVSIGPGSGRATMSVDECAAYLGIGRSSAYEAIHRGEIPVIKIGARYLVPRVALDDMLQRAATVLERQER